MKKLLVVVFLVLNVVLLASCSGGIDKKKIGVIQLVDHPSLNIIYSNIVDEFEKNGYSSDEINFVNCSGDMNNVQTAANTMQGNSTEVVIAITTPVAQACFNLAKNKPVIFSAVTDPIAAGLLDDLNNPNNNITGTSDAVSISGIMDTALTFDPTIKSIGYIYNPNESNSVSNLEKLEAYCAAKNIIINKSAVYTSADITLATTTLAKKSDILFVTNDNTVAEGMKILANTAIKLKKMVFVGADSMVYDGGLATVGIDYAELGKETARQAIRVLKGEKISDIPVKVYDTNLNTYVNTDTASALGITIPLSIINGEKYIPVKTLNEVS